MPPTRSRGETAMAVTMMPMPPSHCSRARQRRMPGAMLSRPVSTVDPVVVMPETASNMASVTSRSISESSSRGRAAKALSTTQLRTAIRKDWRRVR